MLHAPHPNLNEEERDSLGEAPEQSLRSAVERGALSLDEIVEQLPPRAAAVVRSMVSEGRPSPSDGPRRRASNGAETQRTRRSLGAALAAIVAGERATPAPEEERLSRSEGRSTPQEVPEEADDVRRQAIYRNLGAWPTLQHAIDQGNLSTDEALGVAHLIDDTLGRYMTGTRYAAP